MFGTDFHGAQGMIPPNRRDPLTFHLLPTAGQVFPLSGKLSQLLFNGSPQLFYFFTDIA